METTTLAHGRVPRLLLQVLFVLAGALFATLLSWCVATLTASAGTLPGTDTPAVSTTDTSVALPIAGPLPAANLQAANLPTGTLNTGTLPTGTLKTGPLNTGRLNTGPLETGVVTDTATSATRTAAGSLPSTDLNQAELPSAGLNQTYLTNPVTDSVTAALPTGLPRLTLLSGMPDLRTVTGSLATVDSAASGVELPAQQGRFLRATPVSAGMGPGSGGTASALPEPGVAPTTIEMLAASVKRAGGSRAAATLGKTTAAAIELASAARPSAPDAPTCPDWQCALASVGAGSAGSAGLSRSGDLLSKFAFGDPRRMALLLLGVLPGHRAHVAVATGRQPGVTPD